MSKTVEFKGSSNIRSATLRDDNVLEVSFSNNTRYSFAKVTSDMFEQFKSSDSPGRWFHNNIKSRPKDHAVTQLPNEPAASAPADATPSTVELGDEALAVDAAASAMSSEKTTPINVTLMPPNTASVASDPRVWVFANQPKVDEGDCNPLVLATAEALYIAYVHNSDGKNYRGEECPTWAFLPSATRSHWCAVAIQSQLALQSHVIKTVEDSRTAQIAALQAHVLEVERERDDLIATANKLAGDATAQKPAQRVVHRPWIGRKST